METDDSKQSGLSSTIAVNSRKNRWVAFFLSFLQPGFGQIYNGEKKKGLILWVCFWISLVTVVIPIAIWICGMKDAYDIARGVNSNFKWSSKSFKKDWVSTAYDSVMRLNVMLPVSIVIFLIIILLLRWMWSLT